MPSVDVKGLGVVTRTKKGKIITIRVEAVVSQRKHALLIFGNIDPVLKKAFGFAYTAAKEAYESRSLGSFFAEAKAALSVPPKRTIRKGRSASAAAALSFLSLATGRRVQPDVCVTGKVIKTGTISKIASLKKKRSRPPRKMI